MSWSTVDTATVLASSEYKGLMEDKINPPLHVWPPQRLHLCDLTIFVVILFKMVK